MQEVTQMVVVVFGSDIAQSEEGLVDLSFEFEGHFHGFESGGTFTNGGFGNVLVDNAATSFALITHELVGVVVSKLVYLDGVFTLLLGGFGEELSEAWEGDIFSVKVLRHG